MVVFSDPSSGVREPKGRLAALRWWMSEVSVPMMPVEVTVQEPFKCATGTAQLEQVRAVDADADIGS
jgi:hypothetical protein